MHGFSVLIRFAGFQGNGCGADVAGKGFCKNELSGTCHGRIPPWGIRFNWSVVNLRCCKPGAKRGSPFANSFFSKRYGKWEIHGRTPAEAHARRKFTVGKIRPSFFTNPSPSIALRSSRTPTTLARTDAVGRPASGVLAALRILGLSGLQLFSYRKVAEDSRREGGVPP
jgi:hypothetical protein